MGCGPSQAPVNAEKIKQENKYNSAIDGHMAGSLQRAKKTNKLLLLGTGSSGKSTLFKGLRIINGNQVQVREQADTRHVIRANLVAGMLTLLQKSAILFERDKSEYARCNVDLSDAQAVKRIEILMKFGDETFSNDDLMEPSDLNDLGQSIALLWSLPAVQHTFHIRGGRFSFPDNMDHYFNKAEDIMRMDYLPSNQDYLKARQRTTGVITMKYEHESNVFEIYDVGGQRNERKKWIHSFDSVAAVLFVAALNHFNAVLFEDESINAMHEALELFHEVCNSKWFRNSEIILFLNKLDLFDISIGEGNSLKSAFTEANRWFGDQWEGSDYVPKENVMFMDDPDYKPCRDAALEFIQTQFKKLNEDSNKTIFPHFTCGTDTDNVKTVFWDVQNMVIRNNLKRSGLFV